MKFKVLRSRASSPTTLHFRGAMGCTEPLSLVAASFPYLDLHWASLPAPPIGPCHTMLACPSHPAPCHLTLSVCCALSSQLSLTSDLHQIASVVVGGTLYVVIWWDSFFWLLGYHPILPKHPFKIQWGIHAFFVIPPFLVYFWQYPPMHCMCKIGLWGLPLGRLSDDLTHLLSAWKSLTSYNLVIPWEWIEYVAGMKH